MKQSDLTKKLIKYTLIAVGAIVGLFILVGVGKWVFSLIFGTKMAYTKIESTMVNAAEAYYKENPHLLPSDEYGETRVNVTELVTAGQMRELEKYVNKDVSCTGYVIALKNGGHYTYVPRLYCGGAYSTNELVKKITSKANIVTEGDGLYEVDGSYVYRGEKINNYVSFAGRIWRIIKINQDGTIRLLQDDEFDQALWDDRYNQQVGYESGINDYTVSRIKDTLESIYNKKENFSNKAKAMIVPQNLCIGKRKETETKNDGSIECSKTLPNQNIGLLQVNEYLTASIDKTCKKITDNQCANYNYLANYGHPFWTQTANAANTKEVYAISGIPKESVAIRYSYIKVVVTVSGSLNYTKGTGTASNPYVIES